VGKVTRRQLQTLLAAFTLLLLAGCTGLGWQNRQEQQLSASLEMLRAGEVRKSHDLLEDVVNAPAVGGVTDEALFRLSLLLITEEIGAKSAPRAQALLERLRKEHPESSWTPQANLLLSWLTSPKGGRDRDREQINHLLLENRQLIRQNKELRQNIERLKNLDLEMEKKRKR
jgi:hypothetical protein